MSSLKEPAVALLLQSVKEQVCTTLIIYELVQWCLPFYRAGAYQARVEGGACAAPFPLDAQSALLSRQFLFIFL